jgi:hypothetical protein
MAALLHAAGHALASPPIWAPHSQRTHLTEANARSCRRVRRAGWG